MLEESFRKIREEFEDHLTCINENTNEINANYEYLCELDAKIKKMTERLDELELYIKGGAAQQQFKVSPLTPREQEVFLVIYTFGGKEGGLTYKEISRRTALPEHMIISYITNLSMKGVPIIRMQKEEGISVDILKEFRDIQAKETIVPINESLLKKIQPTHQDN